jgi:hypothetical protein
MSTSRRQLLSIALGAGAALSAAGLAGAVVGAWETAEQR